MNVLTLSLLIILLSFAEASVFDDLGNSLRNFIEKTQKSLSARSESLISVINEKLDSAEVMLEKSTSKFKDMAQKLQIEGKKLKVTMMKTAETTLKGAGDEVEDFFAEVPNRVNNGLDEILTRIRDVFSWIFRNVIVPILIIIIALGLLYLFVVSGCCTCCCVSLMTQMNVSLGDTFKHFRKQQTEHPASRTEGTRIIILHDLDVAIPLQSDHDDHCPGCNAAVDAKLLRI